VAALREKFAKGVAFAETWVPRDKNAAAIRKLVQARRRFDNSPTSA
jgi:hypothetical protein